MTGKITSYQRRKRDVAYLEQCVKELEFIAKYFAKQFVEQGGVIGILPTPGITEDMFLTPYSCPDAWNGGFEAEVKGLNG
jgi:hypothetical protein